MKTLVVSVIIAMTSLVNVVSAHAANKFAYNTEVNGGRVENQTVYTVENNKYLYNHLKYNFTYDAAGRIIRKEVLKWNEATKAFEKHHSLNFFYTDDVTIEYAVWNKSKNAYSDIKAKTVYQTNDDSLRYLSFEWNKKENNWVLVTEHCTNSWNNALLADNE